MKVIVIAHGGLASGLKKTVEMVYGQVDEDIIFYDFLGNSTSEVLCEELKNKIGETSDVLFLTDLLGGTPFLAGGLYKHNYGNTEVLSGVNLPMIISIMEEKDELTLDKLCKYAMEEGKNGISRYSIKTNLETEISEEDGI